MFNSKIIGIIDIGSYSVNIIAGEITYDNKFNLRASIEAPYGGFANGEWLENDLPAVIKAVLEKILNETESDFSAIYVGVPGEFTKIVTKTINKTFRTPKKINSKEIDIIFDEGDTFKGNEQFSSINCSPISYVLDNIKTQTPVGNVAKDISVVVSYILCKQTFMTDIVEILKPFTKTIKFISSPWAEAISLLDVKNRDLGVILVDVGYITTNVMMVKGDGLLEMQSFSKGGGHITADLAYVFNIPYASAFKLKPNVNLNIDPNSGETYLVQTPSADLEYRVKDVQDVVFARIEEICLEIADVISEFKNQPPPYVKVFLTGGGFSDVIGAKNIMADTLKKAVDTIFPQTHNTLNKPRFSSAVGLIDMVAKCSKINIFKRFFVKL